MTWLCAALDASISSLQFAERGGKVAEVRYETTEPLTVAPSMRSVSHERHGSDQPRPVERSSGRSAVRPRLAAARRAAGTLRAIELRGRAFRCGSRIAWPVVALRQHTR